jgi:hypothetical protein
MISDSTNTFEQVGDAAKRLVKDLHPIKEIQWDGGTITKPGVYVGIPLDVYHQKADLFDGPSISKSSLKDLIPVYGGSPKAFWGRWYLNPNRIEKTSSKALDFGKATHCLLLGDEAFDASFVIRPTQWKDYRTDAAKDWRDEMAKAGKTIITPDDLKRIKAIAADAANYDMVKLGILNGAVERTMVFKDKETGIWVKTRPDNRATDGLFADLKTAADFNEEFLERQLFDNFYYGQAAMTRMVCRELNIPFETFVLLFVLNDDVPDTTHVEISPFDIDRGERIIRWALKTIRQCLDSGEWPGARPFDGGERHLKLKPWSAERLDHFLEVEALNAA